MNEPIINELPGSRVEIKFTVTPEEAKPYLDKAVEEVSIGRPIAGFRPGKAPYDAVKAAVGELKLWEMAVESIVRAWFVRTVLQKEIETIGSPEIALDKLVPGQDICFTCTASVMPRVTKPYAADAPFVELKVKEAKESDVDAAIEDLRKMRRQEVVTDAASTREGMVNIDLEIKKDGVVVDGGLSRDYKVYLSEDHYIPKFTDQLVGLKKGEVKNFTLPFPKDHYQKGFAGVDMDFQATIKEVYDIRLPEVDENFAKGLGTESVKALRDLLKLNMTQENERRAMDVAEAELLEALVTKSSFTEVPELLIKEEVRRMFEEMRNDIEQRGGRMEDYLSSLKKSPDQLRLDFVPRAIERVKTALYIRDEGKRLNVDVAETVIDAEIDRILESVSDKEARERVSSPDYREYVTTVMRNRKTLEALKEQGIKGYKEKMAQFAEEDAVHEREHDHVHGPDCHHE